MVTNTSTLFSQDAVGMVHIKGYMYKWIMQDLGKSSVFSAVLTVSCFGSHDLGRSYFCLRHTEQHLALRVCEI